MAVREEKQQYRRPFWQYLLLYLVIAGVVYAGAYYLVFSNRNLAQQYPAGAPNTGGPTGTSASISVNEVVETHTNQEKGDYIADPSDRTLYIFDKDTSGVSNCTGDCATTWRPYIATSVPATLPSNITTIARSDGTAQYAWKGMPLYYYVQDKNPGDINGDGVNGVWHIAKP